jgi:restriction system protein
MAIPDYQSLMLPLLRYAEDRQEHSFQDAVTTLSDLFDLTDDERRQPLPSGVQPLIHNRVGWARTYLKKAGLLESTRRGFFVVTALGLEVLASRPNRIDVKFLKQFEKFVEFQTTKKIDSVSEGDISESPTQTPEETLQNAHKLLTAELSDEILDLLMKCSPAFFERLVVELLVAMGYGGSMKEAGQALGKSGDGGIDGIIKEDRLGLDIIYIQAKRWEGVVGRPEIQKFAGALQGKRSRKGVFLTTSSFSKEATEFASLIESKIILIDGARLTELMIEHNIGVTPVEKYEVKRVDSDYFTEGL